MCGSSLSHCSPKDVTIYLLKNYLSLVSYFPLMIIWINLSKNVKIFCFSGFCAFLVALFQVLGTGFALIVVDKFGRKILLILSEIVMCLSMTSLGTFFYLDENKSCHNETVIQIDQRCNISVIQINQRCNISAGDITKKRCNISQSSII